VLGPIIAAFAPLAVMIVIGGGWQFELWDPVPSLTRVIGGPLASGFPGGSRVFVASSIALWLLGWTALPVLLLAWPFAGFRSLFHPIELVRAVRRAGAEYSVAVLLTAGLFLGAWAATLLPVPRELGMLQAYRAYGVTCSAVVAA